jgi:phosphate transport system substrate-binding protein
MKNTTVLIGLASLLAACGGSGDGVAQAGGLTGTVSVDGSSTVFPITEAVAEEFRSAQPGIRITVGVSGTGGGFKRFIAGELDIADASRLIKPSEQEHCAAAGQTFIELPVAYDGLAVVVNTGTKCATQMTTRELKSMWQRDSTAKTWKDIRADWPERAFKLYAPGQDSGTFDYFTETINGKSGNCRPDVTFSEDDNVLVRGVSGDPDGIAFFGLAYYIENQDKLSCVAIDGGQGAILPSVVSVENGSYAPLSRPLFIYVSPEAAERPEVNSFVEFYLENAATLAGEVGYVPFPANVYGAIKKRYATRTLGSAGSHGTLEELYINN